MLDYNLLNEKLICVRELVHDLELHGTWRNDKPRWRELKKLQKHLEHILINYDR